MDVKATLTVSILVHGELWGLIACHHYAPKYSPLWMRSACELLGQLVALRVLGFLDSEQYKAQANGAELFNEILSRLDKNDADVGKIFECYSEKLLRFFDCTGAVALLGEDTLRSGLTPIAEAWRISAALERNGEPVFNTNCLREILGEDSPSGFAGLLAIRVSTLRNEWIAFFRSEQRTLVTWAGDPRKSVTVSSDGVRLHPRGSFALWTEEVKDRSKDWSLAEVSAANILREKILELRQENMDRERLQNEALRRQREDLLAGLTHDLKNPILGTIKMLEHIRKGKFEISDVLDQLIDSQKKLYTRVSSFLLLQKYGEQGDEFSYSTISLKSLIDDASGICRPYAKSEGVALDVRADQDCTVLGEHDAICRVVENLINNAIKFSPSGGTVSIKLEPSGPDALISVIDSGAGVPAEELPLIFKRFWQGQSSRQIANGSGLGLYTCRQIVESHHGRIWCESKDGTGASFFVKLPSIVTIKD
jgi:light-regulated signal transduction histidine kinase (bacteriophytochrome)